MPPMQLYKISQEAVSNSIKHGKATQVSIELASSDHELVLRIKNDGVASQLPPPSPARPAYLNYQANTLARPRINRE